MARASKMDAVTGSFGYTGKHITQRLLDMGRQVRTLTGHVNRPNPFGERITIAPLVFSHRRDLIENLRKVRTLYNTYWVRFAHKDTTFGQAVENSRILFEAAREAGVERIVHISISNPSEQSPLPYFSGKALVEKALIESGVSCAIVRPTVIFGHEDILINNIAWFLRSFPAFFVPGDGSYRLQPVHVEDVARLAVEAGQRRDNVVLDAAGPEIMTFDELVRQIRDRIGSITAIGHLPPGLALALTQAIGFFLGDVVLTREEADGLMAELLVSHAPPAAEIRFSDWLAANARTLGKRYRCELKKHYR